MTKYGINFSNETILENTFTSMIKGPCPFINTVIKCDSSLLCKTTDKHELEKMCARCILQKITFFVNGIEVYIRYKGDHYELVR